MVREFLGRGWYGIVWFVGGLGKSKQSMARVWVNDGRIADCREGTQ